MKVIFLDVDGVLNYKNSKSKVEDEKVKLLKEIVEKTDARIVLSSDWRYWWDTDDEDFLLLKRKLKENGMDMISKTPTTKHGYRGAEIYQWINEWDGETIDKFVILDDQYDMKPYMDRLIQTDFKQGLTEENAEKAIEILNE